MSSEHLKLAVFLTAAARNDLQVEVLVQLLVRAHPSGGSLGHRGRY